MSYVKPEEVRSPREYWTLIHVIIDQGEGQWALALGEWEGVRRLGIRWNGTSEKPAGNPQSRGIATWFVLPVGFEETLMAIVPPDKVTLVKALMNRS